MPGLNKRRRWKSIKNHVNRILGSLTKHIQHYERELIEIYKVIGLCNLGIETEDKLFVLIDILYEVDGRRIYPFTQEVTDFGGDFDTLKICPSTYDMNIKLYR